MAGLAAIFAGSWNGLSTKQGLQNLSCMTRVLPRHFCTRWAMGSETLLFDR